MRIVTEDEAKTLLCHRTLESADFGDGLESVGSPCIGKSCMAFHYKTKQFKDDGSEDMEDVFYCADQNS